MGDLILHFLVELTFCSVDCSATALGWFEPDDERLILLGSEDVFLPFNSAMMPNRPQIVTS